MKSSMHAAPTGCRCLCRCFLALAILVSISAGSASASIVTYTLNNYGSSNINVQVKVDDNTAGLLSFVVSILPNVSLPNTGDLLGVFLEFNPHPTLSTTTSFTGADITSVVLNTISPTGGNNLSGTIAGLVPGGTFDAGITLGTTGSSGGLLTTSSFTLDDNGGTIDLSDIVGIGVRAQTVGLPPSGGGSSSKLYGEVGIPTPVSVEIPPHMPEPTSALVWLGLAGVISVARRARS